MKASWLLTTLAIVFVSLGAAKASAGCRTLGFSVNDFGKEIPTRDSKKLLDKYIADWTAERGIKDYRVGKKSVTCELYLDLIIFDEYTCKAVAKFCWGDQKNTIAAQ